eukprot:SAG25_NODE_134_length_14400_cov_805.311049_1_plen_79_part_00
MVVPPPYHPGTNWFCSRRYRKSDVRRPPPVPTPNGAESIATKLKELKDLLGQGLISADDFEAVKNGTPCQYTHNYIAL